MHSLFFLAHPYKIDPYRKFFRNRSMVFSQWIDLSLGDDGSCTWSLSSGGAVMFVNEAMRRSLPRSIFTQIVPIITNFWSRYLHHTLLAVWLFIVFQFAFNNSGIVVNILIKKFQLAFSCIYFIDQFLKRPFSSDCLFADGFLKNIYGNIVVLTVL